MSLFTENPKTLQEIIQDYLILRAGQDEFGTYYVCTYSTETGQTGIWLSGDDESIYGVACISQQEEDADIFLDNFYRDPYRTKPYLVIVDKQDNNP